MKFSCLLAILAVFVSCTYGDFTYSNDGIGMELTINVDFTWGGTTITGGASIHVDVPGDFELHGETLNITTTSLNINAVTAVSTNPLVVDFTVSDDVINAQTYSFVLRNIFSPRVSYTASSMASVDARPLTSPSTVNSPISATAAYQTVTGLSYGYTLTASNEATTTSGNTYLVVDRSYLDTASQYTVSSLTLYSFGGAAFTLDNAAALKVYTRAPGSHTLVLSSSTTFTIPAGASPVTINFDTTRAHVPSFAVIGIFTTNTLSLSDCAAPNCFGGHYEIVGNSGNNVDISAAWHAQELSISITRTLARTGNDLSGLTVSNGTLSPNFAAGTPSYTVSLPMDTTWETVTPTVDATTGATFVINKPGPQHLNPGTTTPFTITVTAENGVNNVYTVTVTVAAPPGPGKPPFPCFGLIGTLNRVGYWTGAHFTAGIFDNTKCVVAVLNSLPVIPWTYRLFPTTLTISSNYLNSGMFFGLLVAGALPDPIPLDPPVPIQPFTNVTALYIDQFGQNKTLSPSGGQFNFPNPDVAGNCRIILTGVVQTEFGVWVTEYDIQVVVQRVSVARTMLANSATFTNILTVAVQASAVLPADQFGQFAISLTTALGAPFDPWRVVVISSDSSSGHPQIVIGFMDNQDQTRLSVASTQSLQDLFVDAVNVVNNPYHAKLLSLGYGLDLSVAALADVDRSTAPQITPCDNGLWYLFGDVVSPVCGTIPDPSSSGGSSDRHVLADALTGLFVGTALLLVVAGFIYYKWIAKGQPTDGQTKSGMGMELNTMPNDTAASAPVAVPAAQLSAVETPTSGETK